MKVPFFRPSLGQAEIDEVTDSLRSGWLTTGPKVERFEAAFAAAVGSHRAMAVNSCTAAMHLAVEALGLTSSDSVLVPTMTFAATAEVVRYLGATPLLVDCGPEDLLMDLTHAEETLQRAGQGRLPGLAGTPSRVVGMIPVHVGGLMMDVGASDLRRAPRPVGRRGRRPRLPGRLAPGPDALAALRRRHRRRHAASPSTPTRRSPPAKAAWR